MKRIQKSAAKLRTEVYFRLALDAYTPGNSTGRPTKSTSRVVEHRGKVYFLLRARQRLLAVFVHRPGGSNEPLDLQPVATWPREIETL